MSSSALDLIDCIINEIDTYFAHDVINIIDTHIHLWDVTTCRREWLLEKGLEDINATFDINRYCSMYQNNSSINLQYGIFMETDVVDADIEKEVNEVSSVCKSPSNNVKSIIMKLDPNKPSQEFNDLVTKYKANKFIVGVRTVLFNSHWQNNTIPQQVIQNFQTLAGANLVFDLCVSIETLPSVELLVKSVPSSMVFVLDHMANGHQIGANDRLLNIWKENMVKLSKYKNVCIKISGLSGIGDSPQNARKWTFDIERERVDFVVETFADSQLCYGSDWPVSALPLEKNERCLFLNKWTKTLYHHLKQKYGKQLCDKVFVQNPMRIYKLQ